MHPATACNTHSRLGVALFRLLISPNAASKASKRSFTLWIVSNIQALSDICALSRFKNGDTVSRWEKKLHLLKLPHVHKRSAQFNRQHLRSCMFPLFTKAHCKNDHLRFYLEEHVSAVARDQYLKIKTRQNVNANLNKLKRLNRSSCHFRRCQTYRKNLHRRLNPTANFKCLESWEIGGQQSHPAHTRQSLKTKLPLRVREFNRRWPESEQHRRCPRCVLSASSGSRTPPSGCCASSPGSRRWAGWPGAAWRPGSEPPDGRSTPRGTPKQALQTAPPAALWWSLLPWCGSGRPADPPYCAGGSTPSGGKRDCIWDLMTRVVEGKWTHFTSVLKALTLVNPLPDHQIESSFSAPLQSCYILRYLVLQLSMRKNGTSACTALPPGTENFRCDFTTSLPLFWSA